MSKEEGSPRNCPFCNEPPKRIRSFIKVLGDYVYFCEHKHCRLGNANVKFWFSEWQGPPPTRESDTEVDLDVKGPDLQHSPSHY